MLNLEIVCNTLNRIFGVVKEPRCRSYRLELGQKQTWRTSVFSKIALPTNSNVSLSCKSQSTIHQSVWCVEVSPAKLWLQVVQFTDSKHNFEAPVSSHMLLRWSALYCTQLGLDSGSLSASNNKGWMGSKSDAKFLPYLQSICSSRNCSNSLIWRRASDVLRPAWRICTWQCTLETFREYL